MFKDLRLTYWYRSHCVFILMLFFYMCTFKIGTPLLLSAQELNVKVVPKVPAQDSLTSADAQWFIAQVNRGLRHVYVESTVAAWNHLTNLTPDNEKKEAQSTAQVMAYLSAVIPLAARFDTVKTDQLTRRQLTLLKRSTVLPAPLNTADRTRLATVASQLQSMYGKGKACRLINGTEHCRDLEMLEKVMRESQDPQELLQAWQDWRETSKAMKALYQELLTLGNTGAKTVNFKDMGDLWRSQYDMAPIEFENEIKRLWKQVEPLYKALHCHVRAHLNQKYGDQIVALDQAIPAHLLGNMWAQDWSYLYEDLIPFRKQKSLNISKALQAKKYTPKSLTRLAEDFFTSLGFDPLPKTFWTRSLFEKPTDREVVCHASAWDVHYNNDLRLKMCVKIDQEDLIILHHELGHHYYFQSYYTLPIILQEGANDGFHEGIGDTLALSVTPQYLYQKGILPQASENPKAILNQQMKMGLEKLSFLPFGLLVDLWRWRVFSGQILPDQYNQEWWRLREDIQGIKAPIKRDVDAFDPGAKYHIASHTPYMRYFIAHILQFQFHRALCKVSGHQGPLHTCSIYGSKEAGKRLQQMLALGAQVPWPQALAKLTGETRMDASAILDYFKPLAHYLERQNKGRHCQW
jgi:peptidyl-dipeptidase A